MTDSPAATTGKRIKQGWIDAADQAGIEISTGTGGPGLDCTPGFTSPGR
jgi:hypothetical protein